MTAAARSQYYVQCLRVYFNLTKAENVNKNTAAIFQRGNDFRLTFYSLEGQKEGEWGRGGGGRDVEWINRNELEDKNS